MTATAKAAEREAEQKHTPGPWTATTEGISGRRVFMPDDTVEIRGHGGRGLIACLYAHNWAGKQDEANASLVAAAPELLAALKLCVGFCSGHQETPEKVARYQQVIAAIAKATGSAS